MEKQPKQVENLYNSEIVPIERARFTDTLDPHYENTWSQLESAVRASGLNYVETYGSIWNNEALPQVFRDRALLHIGNLDARTQVNINRYGEYYVSNIRHNQLIASKSSYLWCRDMTPIANWMNDLGQYESTKGTAVMEPSAQLVWAYVLYEKKYFNDEELSRQISRFIPSEVSPNFEDYDRKDYDSIGYCHPRKNRINYLDHIFQEQSITKDMARMKSWSLNMLNLWMVNYDNDDALPHWLRGTNKDGVLPLVQSILRLRHASRDNKDQEIPIETLRNARQVYSWKELLKDSDPYRQDTEYIHYAPNVLKQLAGHPDLELDLISFITQSRQPYRGDAGYLHKVASKLGDKRLLEQVLQIEKKQSEELSLANHKRQKNGGLYLGISSDKLKLEELDKQAKALQERIAHKEAYEGLLAVLEAAHTFTKEDDNGTTK